MGSSCYSSVSNGIMADVVTVECHASNNLPAVVIVGSAGRVVRESRDRLRGAFAACGLRLPPKRITINLAPADLSKHDTSLDLALAAAILRISKSLHNEIPKTIAFIGELGLDGSLKPVRGVIAKLKALRAADVAQCFVPSGNSHQASLVRDIECLAATSLRDVIDHLNGVRPLRPVLAHYVPVAPVAALSQIAGQETAKRALVIAAAGGHHTYLSGPPGSGKTMLAHATVGLLPAPSLDDALTITDLRSYTTQNFNQLNAIRPFRRPHNSIRISGLVGSRGKPGELTLSHLGVLCLDEFPEFDRSVLESLRQPLEDRTVQVSWQGKGLDMPADCLVIATANPCPCGYLGSTVKHCVCSGAALARYSRKVSGPLLERFDLWCHVDQEKLGPLFDASGHVEDHRQYIDAARRCQKQRYGSTYLNATAPTSTFKANLSLTPAAQASLLTAAERLGLSSRAATRVLRVARTVADLDAAKQVSPAHVHEALAFRRRTTSV